MPPLVRVGLGLIVAALLALVVLALIVLPGW